MRKLIFSLAIVGSSYTFSFYKMDRVLAHEMSIKPITFSKINKHTFHGNVQYRNNYINLYLYEPHLGYGLSQNSYEDPQTISLDRIKSKEFDRTEWIEEVSQPSGRSYYTIYFGSDLLRNSIDSIESEESMSYISGGRFKVYKEKSGYVSPIVIQHNSIR